MYCDFQQVFNPTEKQIAERKHHIEELTSRSYEEKWCCTCKHYIPINVNLAPVVTAYPNCDLGGLAMNTCEKYEQLN